MAAERDAQTALTNETPIRRAIGPRDVSRLLTAVAPHARRRLLTVAIVAFCGALLEAAILVILAKSALALAADESRIELAAGVDLSVGSAVIVSAAALLAKVALGVTGARRSARLATAGLSAVRRSLLEGYFRASWPTQSVSRLGDLQELLTTHADRTTTTLLTIASLTSAILNVATLLLTALVINVAAAAGIAAGGLALAAAMRPISTMARRNSAAHAKAGRDFASAVTESVTISREVRVYGVVEEILDVIFARHDRQARHYERSRFLGLISPQLYQGLGLLLLVAGTGVLNWRGGAGLEDVGPVVLLLLRSLSYGQATQGHFHNLNDLVPYLDQLITEMERYRDSAEPEPTGHLVTVGDITFADIGFSYVPDRPVLEHVDAVIARGEMVGVIGPSGSGKSTLLQILLRLRQPTSGALLVDGRDASQISLADWYSRVALVPQEPRLLTGTVAENIAFLRPSSRERIEQAAANAYLDDEIRDLPLGYDETIGPTGMQLSGGQQQRICIARALLGTPDLLVLDEPTSALDGHSEARIQETLAALRGAVTMVIVAHRLTTLISCDRILVLIGGRVEGFDTHERLLATSPFYEDAVRLATLPTEVQQR